MASLSCENNMDHTDRIARPYHSDCNKRIAASLDLHIPNGRHQDLPSNQQSCKEHYNINHFCRTVVESSAQHTRGPYRLNCIRTLMICQRIGQRVQNNCIKTGHNFRNAITVSLLDGILYILTSDCPYLYLYIG
jgi:hypothetical protein